MTLEEVSLSIEDNGGPRTDKNGRDPIGHHNYLVCYEKYTSLIKENVKKVLELGVGEGGSLIMWNKYFTNAHVHAIDNFYVSIDSCNKVVDKNRVAIYNCNYNSVEEFSKTMDIIGGDIDIIIDDGDHQATAQVNAIKFLTKYLSKDGYYFLEDIHVTHGRQSIKDCLDGLGLELVEDYCDLKFLPDNYDEYHMFVIRRKR